MKAAAGDKLVVQRHHVGERDRVGIIKEVHGADGAPPYVVEWIDEEGEHTVWPGSDAHIESFEHQS